MYLISHHLSDAIYMKLPLTHYLAIGAFSGFFAVLGDLLESFLKRCAGVKVPFLC